ncbi:acetyltransferase (GNAT) family protein [Algoriphagus ratkowskyi]|uniref:Acetyltransferase (GNAT) family protein n=1 Tax=Algoriphagus ratkowskyi TaxID=57028 RepID=A0A2W7QYX0_9BACT|nr:GNAT family N-acetyltransferase [Algoriphagus ratkowskyi]PZX53484.1 acetyltransferase (GNAT) family protein [Algoriphagus ratkowskyi]TXD76481.1 GNAT family N-acetyltransferase [Algoriphagus ratkowskyi]
MKDMLVKLIGLPDISLEEARLLKTEKIVFRRAIAPEKHIVSAWVWEHFGEYWKSELEVAFSRQPVACWLAQRGNEILGFACYESTARNFFGPTGTLESERGKGLGKILLIKSLESMREMGYAYAIIGGVGPEEFYKKMVNAKVIEGSEISIYENLLRKS